MDILKNLLYRNLELLEAELDKALPIIPLYISVADSKKIKHIIKDIYNAIPEELKNDAFFPSKSETTSLYKLLKRFEIILAQSFYIFPNYWVIIKVSDFENLIDIIKAIIPTELEKLKIIKSNFEIIHFNYPETLY